MKREKVKVTTKNANYVKNHLHLSNEELADYTGLTEKIVSEIRDGQTQESLRPQNYGTRIDIKQVREDPNKVRIKRITRETGISRTVVQEDIRDLPWIERKALNGIVYISVREYLKYREYKECND